MNEFETWQQAMRYTDQEAATALGLNINSVRNYRRGLRSDQTVPVRVPDHIQMKMAKLMLGETA